MKVVGKITRAGFAWLTAITMVVAGLPHFQCQCPNGSIKPFCFGIFCSSTGCCCGDVCSGTGRGGVTPPLRCNANATPTRKGRPACCCGHSEGRTAPRDSGPPRLEGKGCQKTLAQQQQLAPSAPTKIVHDSGVAHAAHLASPVFAPLDSARTGTDVGGLHLTAPPPPDLVIVLQRFLI